MIASLALALQAIVPVIEQIQPTADHIAASAVVKISPADEREWTLLSALKDALLTGTGDYTKYSLMEFGSLTGRPIAVRLAEDSFTITVSVPKGQEARAADLLAELLQQPLLSEDDCQPLLDSVPFQQPSAWDIAVCPWRAQARGLKVSDLRDEWSSVVQPDKVFFAGVGAIQPGRLKEEVQNRFTDWPKPPKWLRPKPAEIPLAHPPAGLRAVRLVSQSESGPAVSLAAWALGSGKGASVFRVLRETLRLSYRQETFLSGKSLVVSYLQTKGKAPQAEEARKALLVDVESWDEASRDRALAMAEMSVGGIAWPLPRYVGPERPLADSLEDRSLFAALALAHGGPVTPELELQAMRQVTLANLKETAKAALISARVQVLE